MSEKQAAKAERKAPEVKQVVMEDGRTVAFVGKRRVIVESTVTDSRIYTRFDFANGKVRDFQLAFNDELASKFLALGIKAKVTDSGAAEDSVDAMVGKVDATLKALEAGQWGVERGAGDGAAGESVVVRAIAEATGKDAAWVKAFLERKVKAGEAAGLTHRKLLLSFRQVGTPTAPIIARMEAEAAARSKAKVKEPSVDVASVLEEAMAE